MVRTLKPIHLHVFIFVILAGYADRNKVLDVDEFGPHWTSEILALDHLNVCSYAYHRDKCHQHYGAFELVHATSHLVLFKSL